MADSDTNSDTLVSAPIPVSASESVHHYLIIGMTVPLHQKDNSGNRRLYRGGMDVPPLHFFKMPSSPFVFVEFAMGVCINTI